MANRWWINGSIGLRLLLEALEHMEPGVLPDKVHPRVDGEYRLVVRPVGRTDGFIAMIACKEYSVHLEYLGDASPPIGAGNTQLGEPVAHTARCGTDSGSGRMPAESRM